MECRRVLPLLNSVTISTVGAVADFSVVMSTICKVWSAKGGRELLRLCLLRAVLVGRLLEAGRVWWVAAAVRRGDVLGAGQPRRPAMHAGRFSSNPWTRSIRAVVSSVLVRDTGESVRSCGSDATFRRSGATGDTWITVVSAMVRTNSGQFYA